MKRYKYKKYDDIPSGHWHRATSLATRSLFAILDNLDIHPDNLEELLGQMYNESSSIIEYIKNNLIKK